MVGVSPILVVLLTLVFIAAVISYTVLSTARPALTDILSPNVGTLDKENIVGTPSDARDKFLSPPGATLIVYLFCAVNGKTASVPVAGSQDPVTILKMGSAMQLQLLPGGASSAPTTKLVIKTQGPANAPLEDIQLKDFPLQKWVQLVIVREGRRFTVYYNGEIVASQRTLYYPVINSSQLTIGSSRLRGEFVYPRMAPTPYQIHEVKQDLAQTSDTRHEPTKPANFNETVSIFTQLGGCPKGIFCFSTSSPPRADPLKMWQTPYA